MNDAGSAPLPVGRTLGDSSPSFRHPRRPRPGAPNVVMIVLDDLGFADFGCYGSHISTPHIDQIAAQGLRYSNFHVTAVCAPTRACLLTGRNHHAVGMGSLSDFPMGFPGYDGHIPKSAGTLPRLLRDVGYNTFAVGKWHLTPAYERDATGPFDRWPIGLGFERYYGFINGVTNQWAPNLVRDNSCVDPPYPPDEGYHLTEDLASEAIQYVQDQQQQAPEKPFFLYFAPGAMHSPHQVPAEWIEPYRGRFNNGWDALRHESYLRQQELGVIPPGSALTTRPSWVRSWDSLSQDERTIFARQMEVYAGFLTHTDAQIGRILGFLQEIDALDNTVVMVLSDNGASGEGGENGSLGIAGATDIRTMVQRLDEAGGLLAGGIYSSGWAWASNTPFKLWKRYSWLGGVRVPLIIQWNAELHDDHNGNVRTQFCHAIDLMPTILEAASIKAPGVLDGVTQQELHGASILPTLTDPDTPSPRITQYFETLGSRAVYHDGWKAVTNHVDTSSASERKLLDGSHDFDTDRWALFDLRSDFTEAHDLAETEPERLRQLVELWWHEAGRNQVLPLISGQALGDFSPERIAAIVPPAEPKRYRYVGRPGGAPIATPTWRAGFDLAADITLPDMHNAAGVICAHHDVLIGSTSRTGWSCYVKANRIIVTVNDAQVSADLTHSGGRHSIGIHYHPDDETLATINITIDDAEVGTGRVPGGPSSHILEGSLVIGRDRGLPICDDYQPPFPFTGEIHRIALDLAKIPEPVDIYKQLENTRRND